MNLTSVIDPVEIIFTPTSADATGPAQLQFNSNKKSRNVQGGRDESYLANSLRFKSYIEDASEQFIISESPLQAAPLAAIAETIVTKLGRKIRLVFNVLAEDRKEAYNNYKKLLSLINYLKPMYFQIGKELVPANKNIFGVVHLQFAGLPILRENQLITPTSFSYEINKDLGYIHMPFEDKYKEEIVSDTNMTLVPIGYKITFEGKVNLNIYDTAQIDTEKSFYESHTGGEVTAPARRDGAIPRTDGRRSAAARQRSRERSAGGAPRFSSGGRTQTARSRDASGFTRNPLVKRALTRIERHLDLIWPGQYTVKTPLRPNSQHPHLNAALEDGRLERISDALSTVTGRDGHGNKVEAALRKADPTGRLLRTYDNILWEALRGKDGIEKAPRRKDYYKI